MLTIYFSATGNSRHIAERFSKKMGALCLSIEAELDFAAMFSAHDTIAVCYPIYGSRVPMIMRQFAQRHMDAFAGKKLIIFATQLIFSGDGARAFTDLFPPGHVEVIYAAHFLMPNNVCNLFFLWQTRGRRTRGMLAAAEKKLTRVCADIKAGRVKKTGFSRFAKFLGSLQGKTWPRVEEKAKGDVRIHSGCNACGLCVQICPMKNLNSQDGGITHNGNCTVCYRCLNACPKRAITVLFHAKPKWQYRGLAEKIGDKL